MNFVKKQHTSTHKTPDYGNQLSVNKLASSELEIKDKQFNCNSNMN